MAHFEIDVSELDPTALAVFHAAVTHARKNRETQTHVLPLQKFFRSAGMGDDVHVLEFLLLVDDLRRVTTYSTDFDPGVLRAWSAFDDIEVGSMDIQFSVNQFAMDASEFS